LIDPFENALNNELSPYKLLDPLRHKYEEMRHILDFLPEPSKTILLGNALSLAINSNNPLQTMNEQAIRFRRSKSIAMMFHDLSAFYGISSEFTKDFLKFRWNYNQK